MQLLRWLPRRRQEQGHFHYKVLGVSGGLEQTGAACGVSRGNEPTAPEVSPVSPQCAEELRGRTRCVESSRVPFVQYPLPGFRDMKRASLLPARCFGELRNTAVGREEEALKLRKFLISCAEFYYHKGRQDLGLPSKA